MGDNCTNYNLLETIIKFLGVIGFILSFWTFVSPRIRGVSFEIIPEQQVQLLQGTDVLAFNILTVVTASGSEMKWNTVKFNFAEVHMPDGNIVTFKCRTYVEETGTGQKNSSRNIPVALRGGDSKTITPGFQYNGSQKWLKGDYIVNMNASTTTGTSVKIRSIQFTIDDNSLNVLSNPQAILFVPAKAL